MTFQWEGLHSLTQSLTLSLFHLSFLYSLNISLSHYLTISLSHSHPLTLLHAHTLTLSHSLTITLSHSQTLTLSHSLTITLSKSHTLTLAHTLTLSFSIYHTLTLTFYRFYTLKPSHSPVFCSESRHLFLWGRCPSPWLTAGLCLWQERPHNKWGCEYSPAVSGGRR